MYLQPAIEHAILPMVEMTSIDEEMEGVECSAEENQPSSGFEMEVEVSTTICSFFWRANKTKIFTATYEKTACNQRDTVKHATAVQLCTVHFLSL